MIPAVKPVSPISVWANEVNKALYSGGVSKSPDTLTVRNHNGTVIKSKTLAKINPLFLSIPVAYDKDDNYGVGDMVYITDALNPAGLNIPSGVWLCIRNVPSNKYGSAPDSGSMGNPYYRNPNTNYYPQWPMPDDTDKHFWLLISMYPMEMTVCVNSVMTDYYIAGCEKSGSNAS